VEIVAEEEKGAELANCRGRSGIWTALVDLLDRRGKRVKKKRLEAEGTIAHEIRSQVDNWAGSQTFVMRRSRFRTLSGRISKIEANLHAPKANG